MPMIATDLEKQKRYTRKSRWLRQTELDQRAIDKQRRDATMAQLRERMPKAFIEDDGKTVIFKRAA